MPDPLRIVFAGTPEFAASALAALIDSRHRVVAVYSQPDRRAGRGRKTTPSPVTRLARRHRIAVHQPVSLKVPEATETLRGLAPDLMVVAAYGLILPPVILALPALGCVNIHASLLPRWRGAAPIQRAIMAGDTQTGISIMQMDAGLDTGPLLAVRKCPIDGRDTAGTLQRKLASLGAAALLDTLDAWQRQVIDPVPQDPAAATYAQRITKAEGRLEWQCPAAGLERRIRAFDPWPVAYTDDGSERLRVWSAAVLEQSSGARPGTVVHASADGVDVATGDGTLRLLRLQRPGRRPVSARDFLNASTLAPGTVLGAAGI